MVREATAGARRATGIRRRAIGAGVILVLLSAGGAAAADAALAAMEGTWIGRGSGRLGPESAPERLYCKVTNTLADDGNRLTQAGRCALGNNTATLSGEIVRGGGGYSGQMTSPQLNTAQVSGSGGADYLSLTATATDPDTGDTIHAAVAIRIAGGGYTMTITRGDVQTTELSFVRGQ